MSIHLKLDNADFDQPKENHVQLQFIPASVEESAIANVDQYFNNYTTEVDGFLKNSLRGFPLNGCQFQVPESHRGIVFQEDQRPLDENAERTFKVSGIFNEFTYWNYDKVPSDNDKLKQALDWNNFSKALHTPITPEEYEAEQVKS
ncbi:ribonuclease H2 subunit C [Sitodiplosis mosellana]|uniref:ribonuclease H2 subunit C n=1 Tax=Sitodiplosis mosellana TaxID=263140 RepID=UPI002444C37E|nr:ribonuclease H2 subunit C [Sitodiplosis mosellana]